MPDPEKFHHAEADFDAVPLTQSVLKKNNPVKKITDDQREDPEMKKIYEAIATGKNFLE